MAEKTKKEKITENVTETDKEEITGLLEKENERLRKQNAELVDLCHKYDKMVTGYRDLVIAQRNQITELIKQNEYLYEKAIRKHTFAEVYYETVREILS